MADSPRPAGTGWLQADPDQLDRFADELNQLIDILERIQAKEADAALFRSPSVDPATIRATDRLAADAHDLPGTPARSLAIAIDDLTKQVRAARLAAGDYRSHEEESARSIRKAGEST
jgi:hypothetical protein